MKYKLWAKHFKQWEIINIPEINYLSDYSLQTGIFETDNINIVYKFIEYLIIYYTNNSMIKTCDWDIIDVSEAKKNK